MTTIIRAIGANFTNPDLPSIVQFVEDGLVAAYRPSNKSDGLNDLSGNGHNLIPIGSPVLTATGMIGDAVNGYDTRLLETNSLTYIAVYKIPAETFNTGGFVMGCFNAFPPTGSSFYTIKKVGTAHEIIAQYRAKSSTGAVVSKDSVIANIPNQYVFIAMSIDSVANKVKVYAPALGVNNEVLLADNVLSTRNKSETITNKLIANSYYTSWLSKVHLSEALLYDKALSDSQIQSQYVKSKAYMSSVGITI